MIFFDGIREVALSAFSGFDRSNWISTTAAVIAVFSLVMNNRSASKRDAFKTKREEFNKQIGGPIEKSIDDFREISDELVDLTDNPTELDSDKIDYILSKASKAQRGLARAIRRAANSNLCSNKNWSTLGQDATDGFVESLESIRFAEETDVVGFALDASNFLEGLIDDAYARIYFETSRYI